MFVKNAKCFYVFAVVLLMVLGVFLGCEDPDADGPNQGDDDSDAALADDVDPGDSGNGDNGDEMEAVDILWMLDNSGSMCRSQQMVSEGIDDFVATLEEVDISFQIGVTTSHAQDESVIEPIAKFGRLQATPQPIPGFGLHCSHPLYSADDPDVEADPDAAPHVGDPDPNHLDPVVDSMERAVACTEEPDDWQHLLDFDEDKLRCALPATVRCDDERAAERVAIDEDSDFCVCPDGDAADDYPNCLDCAALDHGDIEDYFPTYEIDSMTGEVLDNAYRDIPLVLRSEDYQDESGGLDVESLRDDFSCMSMVGTRGDGFQKGLGAVVEAVSPEMTGGTYEEYEDAQAARDDYPNAGLLREDAHTALMFVSSSNDCSYEDEINRDCGGHSCTIAEQRLVSDDVDCDEDDAGCLTATDELADLFVEHIADSRDGIEPDDLDDSERESIKNTIIPASIHGTYQDLDETAAITGEPVPEECPETRVDWADDWEPGTSVTWVEPHSCQTEMGRGWSGHRYAQFLGEFPSFYPRPSPADQSPPEIGGEICTTNFDSVLANTAQFFASGGD